MGSCAVKMTKEEKKQAMISKQIDKKATKDFKSMDEIIKVLLLGPGESGKSTLLKQMNTLYAGGFDENESRSFIHVIRNNLLESFQTLLEMSDVSFDKGIEGTKISDQNEPIKQQILDSHNLEENDSRWQEVCNNIYKLWNEEPGLKIVYENRATFQLPGAGDYFIQKSDKIGNPGFFPSQDDIMRARVRTTGIVEKKFSIGTSNFSVCDVGGQRNERRKWIHSFEGVTCVIFVISLTGYNEVLYEDETVFRMKEALELFEEISNSKYFRQASIVLFLNKMDLFKEKIKKIPISVLFPDYKGPSSDFDASIDFIKKKFLNLVAIKDKDIYTHVTCATNNDNIKHVMAAVTDVFIKNKLAKGGLLY